jgi:vancomycin resistance protein YoaR
LALRTWNFTLFPYTPAVRYAFSRIGLLGLIGVLGFVGFLESAQAATLPSTAITFRYRHHLFSLTPSNFPQWRSNKEVWLYKGQPFDPPAKYLVDGDTVPALPEGVVKSTVPAWDETAIRDTIEAKVGTPLRLTPGKVTINRDAKGVITFDGVGLPGREVNLDETVMLAIAAMERGITDIEVPVTITQPQMTVDAGLQAEGIKQVISVGESDYSNSPANRIHNITVGMNRFNGHLVPKGSIFSFDETLGPVNGTTGYKLELVIKGDRTEPDYGGGLCQVSSTAYRGVWEYGLPIVQRRNHSYSVSHYFPQGTDATVYPPSVDMKFKNDTPGSILMQTYRQGDNAYFIYYGTDDGRKSQVVGPYIWDRVGSPGDRIEKTTSLAPGVVKKLGERVPGLKAAWFRIRSTATGASVVEPVYSHYQARPLYLLVGAAAAPVEEVPPVGDVTVVD